MRLVAAEPVASITPTTSPGRERADQSLVGAGGGDIGLLDRDPAGVDDDASHARQGTFLSWMDNTWPA
jgi:hypothetical protein